MYELHKTWCADTLLSNSVMCAIGVLQHDKQKCWSPKCISSAHIERGRGSRSAERPSQCTPMDVRICYGIGIFVWVPWWFNCLGFVTQRTLVRIPERRKKKQTRKHHKYSSPPICKTDTWSCTGEQSTLAVCHCPLNIGYTMKRRAIRDLFHRGNRCIDVPSAQREGVYFGFQGEINLVLPDGFIV